jgi:hypothetical protein
VSTSISTKNRWNPGMWPLPRGFNRLSYEGTVARPDLNNDLNNPSLVRALARAHACMIVACTESKARAFVIPSEPARAAIKTGIFGRLTPKVHLGQEWRIEFPYRNIREEWARTKGRARDTVSRARPSRLGLRRRVSRYIVSITKAATHARMHAAAAATAEAACMPVHACQPRSMHQQPATASSQQQTAASSSQQ